jgi:hypothetical protein
MGTYYFPGMFPTSIMVESRDSWLHVLCATRVVNQLCRTLNLRTKVESRLKLNALNTHIYPHHLSLAIDGEYFTH